MLFEQDNKLCKRDLKSFEKNIKLSERVKNKTGMSLRKCASVHVSVHPPVSIFLCDIVCHSAGLYVFFPFVLCLIVHPSSCLPPV